MKGWTAPLVILVAFTLFGLAGSSESPPGDMLSLSSRGPGEGPGVTLRYAGCGENVLVGGGFQRDTWTAEFSGAGKLSFVDLPSRGAGGRVKLDGAGYATLSTSGPIEDRVYAFHAYLHAAIARETGTFTVVIRESGGPQAGKPVETSIPVGEGPGWRLASATWRPRDPASTSAEVLIMYDASEAAPRMAHVADVSLRPCPELAWSVPQRALLLGEKWRAATATVEPSPALGPRDEGGVVSLRSHDKEGRSNGQALIEKQGVNGAWAFSVWVRSTDGSAVRGSVGISDRGSTATVASTDFTADETWRLVSVGGTTSGADPGVTFRVAVERRDLSILIASPAAALATPGGDVFESDPPEAGLAEALLFLDGRMGPKRQVIVPERSATGRLEAAPSASPGAPVIVRFEGCGASVLQNGDFGMGLAGWSAYNGETGGALEARAVDDPVRGPAVEVGARGTERGGTIFLEQSADVESRPYAFRVWARAGSDVGRFVVLLRESRGALSDPEHVDTLIPFPASTEWSLLSVPWSPQDPGSVRFTVLLRFEAPAGSSPVARFAEASLSACPPLQWAVEKDEDALPLGAWRPILATVDHTRVRGPDGDVDAARLNSTDPFGNFNGVMRLERDGPSGAYELSAWVKSPSGAPIEGTIRLSERERPGPEHSKGFTAGKEWTRVHVRGTSPSGSLAASIGVKDTGASLLVARPVLSRAFLAGDELELKFASAGTHHVRVQVASGDLIETAVAVRNVPPRVVLEHALPKSPGGRVLFDASGSTDPDAVELLANGDFSFGHAGWTYDPVEIGAGGMHVEADGEKGNALVIRVPSEHGAGTAWAYQRVPFDASIAYEFETWVRDGSDHLGYLLVLRETGSAHGPRDHVTRVGAVGPTWTRVTASFVPKHPDSTTLEVHLRFLPRGEEAAEAWFANASLRRALDHEWTLDGEALAERGPRLHAPLSKGEHTVRVRVRDGAGGVSESSQSITIGDEDAARAIASITGPPALFVGRANTLTAAGSLVPPFNLLWNADFARGIEDWEVEASDVEWRVHASAEQADGTSNIATLSLLGRHPEASVSFRQPITIDRQGNYEFHVRYRDDGAREHAFIIREEKVGGIPGPAKDTVVTAPASRDWRNVHAVWTPRSSVPSVVTVFLRTVFEEGMNGNASYSDVSFHPASEYAWEIGSKRPIAAQGDSIVVTPATLDNVHLKLTVRNAPYEAEVERSFPVFPSNWRISPALDGGYVAHGSPFGRDVIALAWEDGNPVPPNGPLRSRLDPAGEPKLYAVLDSGERILVASRPDANTLSAIGRPMTERSERLRGDTVRFTVTVEDPAAEGVRITLLTQGRGIASALLAPSRPREFEGDVGIPFWALPGTLDSRIDVWNGTTGWSREDSGVIVLRATPDGVPQPLVFTVLIALAATGLYASLRRSRV